MSRSRMLRLDSVDVNIVCQLPVYEIRVRFGRVLICARQ